MARVTLPSKSLQPDIPSGRRLMNSSMHTTPLSPPSSLDITNSQTTLSTKESKCSVTRSQLAQDQNQSSLNQPMRLQLIGEQRMLSLQSRIRVLVAHAGLSLPLV